MSPSSACRRSATGLLCALGAGLATAGPAPRARLTRRGTVARARPTSPSRRRIAPSPSSPTAARGQRPRAPTALAAPTTTARPSARPRTSASRARPPRPRSTPTPASPSTSRSTAKSSVDDFAPGEAGFNLVVRGAHAEATAACTGRRPGPERLQPASPLVIINGQDVDSRQVQQTVEQLPTGADREDQVQRADALGHHAHPARRAPRGPGSGRPDRQGRRGGRGQGLRRQPGLRPRRAGGHRHGGDGNGRAAAATPTSPASAAPSTIADAQPLRHHARARRQPRQRPRAS